MVFKPINLARQSFVKTFTHGYAQSLVAATQTSSASQNTSFHTLSTNVVSFFGKPGSSQSAQYAQLNSASSVGAGPNAGAGLKSSQGDASGGEGGLAAYYAAWQKHQRAEEKEWHQFQFAKRIGWKAPTTIPDPQAKAKLAKPTDTLERPSRVIIERAKSTSAVDDLKNTKPTEVAEAAAIAQVDEAIAKEIESVQHTHFSTEASAEVQDVSQEVVSVAEESLARTTSPSNATLSQSRSTPATSVSEVESYTEHLERLAECHRYAEVPPVFEALLLTGAKPSSSAYNTLLLAAINLPRGKHQVVPKVLDVYSDMLRRRVAPDTSTYAILIELLAARALDVTGMKKELAEKKSRYGGMEGPGSFMFRSDETESKILAEDDSLTLAIRLFDTSAAVATSHLFPAETYRLLICACAEEGRIGDMVRVYADMESQRIPPPTSIFAPMIQAFASAGDLRSSVECYDEYKALAIAHDMGGKGIVRKDQDVYAAVVQAYAICGRQNGGLKFLGKIEDSMEGSESLSQIRDTVALQALHPQWLMNGRYEEAMTHALEKLTPIARNQALAAICIDAADKNNHDSATEAFKLLQTFDPNPENKAPAIAMLACHARNVNLDAAHAIWMGLSSMKPTAALIESATVYALCTIAAGNAVQGLTEVRNIFAHVRNTGISNQQLNNDVVERIEEAIEVIGRSMLKSAEKLSSSSSMLLMRLMVENGGLVTPISESLLAPLGPIELSHLAWTDLETLAQVEAGFLIDHAHLDIAHEARFVHVVDLLLSSGSAVDPTTSGLIQQALEKINRPDLSARWLDLQIPPALPLASPVDYATVYSPTSSLGPFSYEDTYDPYASSTDFKGSAMIAEELEKPYGRHSAHLNEALVKFKNMRRVGRHPRYLTYAKLITAAAKENRLNLAEEILAMAKHDVPLIAKSRIVRHGWVSILDAMVGACLTVGNRDVAAQFHQDLLNMNAAPSANTFGLYITTLKETTKTFDEATEAVKIFHRAKSEGIEPTSFLYNALIGKLGKARRIDDCLYYFAEMRNLGIRPTSVTYGTIVNALCRVSDDKFAEELFEEMESMPNYKPRPAPYNSLMQYFLTTKRDRSKVLGYYQRMKANNIEPTMHTYKLLIDTYATLEPINMKAAEGVLSAIKTSGAQPEAVHYASLIHAKGCVLHDVEGAHAIFNSVITEGRIPPQASLYQALFESMVANHNVAATEPLVKQMAEQRVPMTAYIANTLIHGWAMAKDISKAKAIFDMLGREKREPSTYEAMTRAYLAAEEHGNAMSVVGEALRRGYPTAVVNKICDLVGGGGVARTSHVGA